jgi:hypothetical protein
MWSPVRWVAELLRLNVPLRTYDVRMLDSGEADTWRFEWLPNGEGKWRRNENSLTGGTTRRPRELGVLRRNAILRINTNKTSDAHANRATQGYTIPSAANSGLHSNVVYWIAKLRDWQEKYNPISRRTPWTELEGHQGKCSKQAAGHSDRCFLFRMPENGEARARLPISNAVLDHTWHAVLQALEKRLAERGETHADRSTIQLVLSGRDRRTLFPPHSLRVSLMDYPRQKQADQEIERFKRQWGIPKVKLPPTGADYE